MRNNSVLYCNAIIFSFSCIFLTALHEARAQEPFAVPQRSIAAPTPDITGLAYDGKSIWVADWKEDLVYKLDPATGKKLDTIQSPGPRPTGVAWDGAQLWVADLHFNKAYRIDPATKLVTKEIPLPGSYPLGLAWDGKMLRLADRNEKKIFRVSPGDGASFGEVASPGGEITGLAWEGGTLWAANRVDDELYAIDPEKGWVLSVLKAPGPYAWGLAPDGAGGLMVADYADGKVHVVAADPSKGKGWARGAGKEYALDLAVDFYNYGKDPVTEGKLFVALPEGRENQEIAGEPSWKPSPDAVVTKGHGQRYAVFGFKNLAAPARKRVVGSWKVKLFDVDWHLLPGKVQGASAVPKDVAARYLADGEKYQIADPYVAKLAKEIAGDEKNLLLRARRIYEWVIDRLEYKLAGGWEPAPQVLKRGTGSCSEYTFSFIALCRAAGIPARFVGSVVVRKDDASTDDVFHRWAEVYLPPYGWVPVDANHGDKPDGRGRALGFGHLDGRLLVTTVEGAPDENPLGWGYNYDAVFSYKGEANTLLEAIGWWRPAGKKGEGGKACGAAAKGGSKKDAPCECGMP